MKITNYQLALLLIGFLIGSSTIINPVHDGRDAWLAFLIAWIGGLGLVFVYATIARLHPGKTLVEILKSTFGKVVGSMLTLLYIWYFIHLAGLTCRTFGLFLTSTSYPKTPEIFIIGGLVLLSVYTLKKGLQVLGRVAEILVPIVIALLLILFLALFNRYDFGVFFPLLENGLLPVMKKTYGPLVFPFGETVIFLMLFSSLAKPQQVRLTVVLAVAVGGLLIFMSVVRDLMALGPELVSRLYFPPTVSSELIPVISLDPLVATNLLIAGGVHITVCLYAAVVGITQLFRLESDKPLVIPVGIFTVALAMWLFDSIFEMVGFVETYLIYVIPFQFVIPFTILAISLYKKYASKI